MLAAIDHKAQFSEYLPSYSTRSTFVLFLTLGWVFFLICNHNGCYYL